MTTVILNGACDWNSEKMPFIKCASCNCDQTSDDTSNIFPVNEPIRVAIWKRNSGAEPSNSKKKPQPSQLALRPRPSKCSLCSKNFTGFVFVCVQCNVRACSACDARSTHARHYVLRAPSDGPEEQLEEVLRAVRAAVLAAGLAPQTPCEPEPEPQEEEDTDDDEEEIISLEKGSSSSAGDKPSESTANTNNKEQNKKPHIKKPLNAFMLYMKEMRAKVVAECMVTESAAINQIIGRRWNALGREEQAEYYELARRERQLHMQLYPDWSSKPNRQRGKKRKRKQEKTDGGNNLKKCRAIYGLDQQDQWCRPCRRKKKCVRYMEALAAADGTVPLPIVSPQSPCSVYEIKLEDMSDTSSDGDADTPISVGQLTSQPWPRAAQPRPGHEVVSVS